MATNSDEQILGACNYGNDLGLGESSQAEYSAGDETTVERNSVEFGTEDLITFIKETGTLAKTQQWARERSSLKVIAGMFPLCDSDFSDAELDSYVTTEDDTIDYEKIKQELQNLGRIYVNEDGSSSNYMMVTAYLF
ncbi:hypothetical protein Ciccas_012894 [Cichlidogyrus casuarinus]|uniref:DUF2087 domain-containing protein n=1 Tax=Cichlidogyrus casuarinus TaxID=1844966 RepID=A0ABD2PS42_9PLAT